MNKITLFPFFLSLLFSQISFVNELEARYGTSENEYNYSEIFFEKKLWPSFNENDYMKIINEFKNIKRNFGRI